MIIQRRKYRLLSDEDLVLAYASKPSRDIMYVLYERYGHLVLGLCIKYLKQVQNAEDMCASIFEKLPSLLIKHEVRYFKSWLYKVSRNECLMELRKKNSKFSEMEETKIVDEDNLGLEEKKKQEAEINHMESALSELKENQKQCITLFYLEEKSYQEISIALSMSIKAVKSHIQNGKRKLKIVMEAKP
ncbi:MAG: sigma-70 family RNA polymerase sigma factor [Crocinitomicaceae bacterium]|jgi:RNA polymerase sigma factor (sigma-70 family)|nr:sigma-70 family RNA polymerase sigma factor [Crocinitomicaceae bacterium]